MRAIPYKAIAVMLFFPDDISRICTFVAKLRFAVLTTEIAIPQGAWHAGFDRLLLVRLCGNCLYRLRFGVACTY